MLGFSGMVSWYVGTKGCDAKRSHHAMGLTQEVNWGGGEAASEREWKRKEDGNKRHWVFIRGYSACA